MEQGAALAHSGPRYHAWTHKRRPLTLRGTGERVAEAADIQGAVPAPARRRWLRRAVVLLAGTPVLAALIYSPAPKAEAAEAAAAGGGVPMHGRAPPAPGPGGPRPHTRAAGHHRPRE
ncbi:hypothetical protein ACFXA9_36305, partial [Streptomyces sp. NPDC059411]